MSATPSEQQLREEIVQVGRFLREKGLIAATDGNISARYGEDRLLVTPSGVNKGLLRPEDIILTDLDGQPVGTGPTAGSQPSAELRLHLEVYRQRPEMRAVVHAHPPLATAFTVAGLSLETCIIPEVVVTLGTIPTVPYATPTSAEGPEQARAYIRAHDALLLDHHGALTMGKTVMEAYFRLEKVEHTAQILWVARQLGSIVPLTAAQVDKLIAIRRAHGLLRDGDEEMIGNAIAT